MINNRKYIFFDTLLFLVTSIISFFLCFYVLDKIFIPVFIMDYGRITFRLLVSFIIFLLIKWVYNKKMTVLNHWTLFLFYIFFITGLLLSREAFRENIELINLQLGFIKDGFMFIFVANAMMYIPIGIYASKLLKMKTMPLILLALLFILSMETLQLLLRVGYFDINDILLNLISFSIGLLVQSVSRKFNYKSKKIAEHM